MISRKTELTKTTFDKCRVFQLGLGNALQKRPLFLIIVNKHTINFVRLHHLNTYIERILWHKYVHCNEIEYYTLCTCILQILHSVLYQSFHILDEPSVHMNGEVVRVRTGDRVHLNCTVKGIPTPDISWFRNQNNIRRRIETGIYV